MHGADASLRALFAALGVLSLAPPSAALAQPVVEAGPGASVGRQPMRYLLADGMVVVGTQIGEDAEFLIVSTHTGTVRIPRASVRSMDFRIGEPVAPPPVVQAAPPPVVQVAPPALVPPPPVSEEGRRGTKTLVTGIVMLAISHGAGVLAGTVAGPGDDTAYWLVVPLVGPIFWSTQTSCTFTDNQCRELLVSLAGFWAAIQLGGIVCVIVGAARSGDRSESRVQVGPLFARGAQGLSVTARF